MVKRKRQNPRYPNHQNFPNQPNFAQRPQFPGGGPRPPSNMPRLGAPNKNPFDDFFNTHFNSRGPDNSLASQPPPPPAEPNPPLPTSFMPPPPPPPPEATPSYNKETQLTTIEYGHGRQDFRSDEVNRALSDILNYPGTGTLNTLPN